jgi:hypothetical protein
VTIAVAGSAAFTDSYGEPPTFEVFEDGTEADDVPDLVEVFPGSCAAVTTPYGDPPGLSNASETVVLYWWDGVSDLVVDIDVLFWGLDDRWRFSKTGVTIDGLDPDTTPSSYKTETAILMQKPYPDEHDFGESYQRLDMTEGDEIQSGSNGSGGDDEVSENMAVTWGRQQVTPGWIPVESDAEGVNTLSVPGRTFLPLRGERFPILFTAKKGHDVVLRIFDLEGRLVRSLYDSKFDGPALTDPGERSSQEFWDGRDAEFELVPAGLYIVHLLVVNPENGDRETQTAPVVVATRLSH